METPGERGAATVLAVFPHPAEVDDHDPVAAADHVLRLHVGVAQSALVQELERGEDLAAVGQDFGDERWILPVSRQGRQLAQRHAFDVVHRDVIRRLTLGRHLGVLEEVVRSHQIPVLQPGQVPRFGAKRARGSLVVPIAQRLERHLTFEVLVVRQVNRAIAAFRQVLPHLVAAAADPSALLQPRNGRLRTGRPVGSGKFQLRQCHEPRAPPLVGALARGRFGGRATPTRFAEAGLVDPPGIAGAIRARAHVADRFRPLRTRTDLFQPGTFGADEIAGRCQFAIKSVQLIRRHAVGRFRHLPAKSCQPDPEFVGTPRRIGQARRCPRKASPQADDAVLRANQLADSRIELLQPPGRAALRRIFDHRALKVRELFEDRADRDHPRHAVRVAVGGLQHHHPEHRLVPAVQHRGAAEPHLHVAAGGFGEQLYQPAARAGPTSDRQLHPRSVRVLRAMPVAPDGGATLQLGSFDQWGGPGMVPRFGQPQQGDVAARLGLVPAEPGSGRDHPVPVAKGEVQPHLGAGPDHVRAGQRVLAVQQETRSQQHVRLRVKYPHMPLRGIRGCRAALIEHGSTVERAKPGNR